MLEHCKVQVLIEGFRAAMSCSRVCAACWIWVYYTSRAVSALCIDAPMQHAVRPCLCVCDCAGTVLRWCCLLTCIPPTWC